MRATLRRSMLPWTRMQVMLSTAAPLARRRRLPIRRRRRSQARWCLTMLMMRKTYLGRTHVQSPSHPTRTALMSRSSRNKEEQRLQRPQTAANSSSRSSKRSNSRPAEAVEAPLISSRERGVTLRLQLFPKSNHQRHRATVRRRWKMMACTSSSDNYIA